jgi:hypothetical protein
MAESTDSSSEGIEESKKHKRKHSKVSIVHPYLFPHAISLCTRERAQPQDKKQSKKATHRKEKKAKRERAGSLPPGVEPITADDYFRRAPEFQRWLQGSRGQFLDEVPSEEAHKLFSKFVSKWNDGDLPREVYSMGVDGADVPRTRHQCGFTSKLSAAEKLELESARDSIHAQTQRAAGQGRDGAAIARAAGSANRTHSSGAASKRARQEESSAFDEAAAMLGVHTAKPDAGSHEALIERRRAQTAYHRRNDDEGGIHVMSDSMLMGASSDEFAVLAGKGQAAAARKSEQASARVQELQEKERQRMESCKRQMGMFPGEHGGSPEHGGNLESAARRGDLGSRACGCPMPVRSTQSIERQAMQRYVEFVTRESCLYQNLRKA